MQSWKTIVLTVLILLGCASAAIAQPEQTPAEMRTEIDLLRQRVAQLEAQLEAAVLRGEQLQKEIEDLREQLARRPETTEPQKPDTTPEALEVPIDQKLELEPAPEEWSSSPEALFAALQEEYEAVFKDVPRESRSDQQRYFALVGKWARDAERMHREDVAWTIRVTRVLERPDRAGDVTIQVVNTETGRGWGEPFTMMVARPYREMLESTPDRNYWLLEGTLTATPQLNRDREAPGFFLHPLFIGPYAEFGYDFKVRRLTPTTLERENEPSETPASEASEQEGAVGSI